VSDLVPVRRSDRTPARREEARPRPRWDQRIDPFGDFDEMWNRMVSRFFAPWGEGVWGQDWAPPVDIEETDDAWIFEVDLPGARREDLHVEVRDRELAIAGEIQERERAGVLRHRGRRSGAFGYRTSLPAGVDADRVTARFEGGVLTVTVPRPENSKPHRVKIS
jgi:HSP20 family protein